MTTPLYKKADSLIELRSDDPDLRSALARLSGRRDAILASAADASGRAILAQALADLLHGPRPTPDPTRFALRPHVLAELQRITDAELARYLVYRYRYDVFPHTHVVDAFPPCLQVEPTSICNYRCVFCYQTDPQLTSPKNGQMGMMSLDLFKTIIDEAQGRCEAVTLASRGEPLMCRDIDAMLAYAAGKFLAFKINTNAWFLDETKAHALLQADPSTIVFSADAASEPLYSQLRVHGRLDRVLANIERFHDIRARQYPHARVITRVAGVRYGGGQSLDAMETFWGGLVDQVAFVEYNPWENTYERPINDVTAPCSDLWRRMFVWFDGTANPCDVDYRSTLAAGTVPARSLGEVWTGEPYASYRRAHLDGRRSGLSPCNRCTVV